MTTRLPRSLEPVVLAIGVSATLRLVAAYGGAQVYISAAPRPGDALAACIGLELAVALSRALGPGQLEVPRCVGWLAAERRKAVQAGRAQGLTVAQLSRRHGYTQRHIRNLLRDAQHEEMA